MKSLHPLTFKILDWLSGGYLSDQREELEHLTKFFDVVANHNATLRKKLYAAEQRIRDMEENKKPERCGSVVSVRHIVAS